MSRRMICPHCQTRGRVSTRRVKKKSGLSGGKVMMAIFTGGLSLLFTGLSRKDRVTRAYCHSCRNKWEF